MKVKISVYAIVDIDEDQVDNYRGMDVSELSSHVMDNDPKASVRKADSKKKAPEGVE